MKPLAKRLASILGTISSSLGVCLSWSGCETPKLYGPPPPHDEACCSEFNEQFYEQCMDAYRKDGKCIADELKKEQLKE